MKLNSLLLFSALLTLLHPQPASAGAALSEWHNRKNAYCCCAGKQTTQHQIDKNLVEKWGKWNIAERADMCGIHHGRWTGKWAQPCSRSCGIFMDIRNGKLNYWGDLKGTKYPYAAPFNTANTKQLTQIEYIQLKLNGLHKGYPKPTQAETLIKYTPEGIPYIDTGSPKIS